LCRISHTLDRPHPPRRRRNGADLPDRRSWSYASLRRSQQVRRDHALQRSEHHRSRRWSRDGRELHHRPHLL